MRPVQKFRRHPLALALVAAIVACAVALPLFVRSQLPPIYSLADYRPAEASQLFAQGGELLAVWARERRTTVPFAALPSHVVHAFLAAEDADFYHHEGIDWLGVARALLKNLRPGAHLQGASTITQQTVKTLVLGPERSLWRKVREAILARRLEQLMGKDDILTLYLNQIYFGSGAWGVEQAAQTYFGHSIRTASLAEAAQLASIPKSPARYAPSGNRLAAKGRQRWVLGQMLAHGWAEPRAVEAAISAPLLPPDLTHPSFNCAPHFAEAIRRQLVMELGDERVLTGGLKVYSGLRVTDQLAANIALRQGSEDIARRQGYAGAKIRIPIDILTSVVGLFEQAYAATAEEHGLLPHKLTRFGWDISGMKAGAPESAGAAKNMMKLTEIVPYARLRAPVVRLDTRQHKAFINLGQRLGELALNDMRWARTFDPSHASRAPSDPADVLHLGDVVTVEVVAIEPAGPTGQPGAVRLALVPEPELQGAIVAIDPRDRSIRAMVGGTDSDGSGFNHATQARRQPGSAFKPILYASAIDSHTITAATLCNDAPVVIPDPFTGKLWKPENYEDGRYDGPLPFREALNRSKNTCSVRLVQKMGPKAVADMAHAMGIASPMPNNLTLALGTGETTPLELARAFTTLASGGTDAQPIFVRRVTDRDGNVVAPFDGVQPQPTRAMSEQAAYVVTDMMRTVIERGTAFRAQVLGRPLAGKTGTSQKSRDAWFCGFSPQLVTAVWLGFDDNRSMGSQTGSSAALPVWIRLMGSALANENKEPFAPPEGIVTVDIDPKTGMAALPPQGRAEIFIAGTQPRLSAQAPPSIYLQDDDGR